MAALSPSRPPGETRARGRPHPNEAFALALLGALRDSGVRHVCVCPGSRSAPLAAAAHVLAGLRVFAHVDERSAAFFALGLARATRRPVALVCTSGTAAANFHPAVVEASLADVPLVVLTADRPPELRDWGAPQTIDQVDLYGAHARWSAEAPVPGPSAPGPRFAAALGARAVHEATGERPGPVHLNLPFREPLDPAAADGPRPGAAALGGVARRHRPLREPAPGLVAELADLAHRTPRGAIVCGPLDADADLAEAICALGRAAGWPILADVTSGLRAGAHVRGAPLVASGDALLRSAELAERFAPDLVLRLGAPPIGRAVPAWLERHAGARHLVVDPGARRADPLHRATDWLEVEPRPLLERWVRRLASRGQASRDPSWLEGFLRAERCAARTIARAAREGGALGLGAARALADALPAGATLFLSNSMAVRDAETAVAVSPRPLRVLANRGANGIDGVLSTALGAAASGAGPLALLTGDLAFLHDAGALFAARHHAIAATVVVVNDDGGGIFSYLPIAEHGPAVGFDALFRLSHGLSLEGIARGYGAGHRRVCDARALGAAVCESLAAPGVQVLELCVDPARNADHHRALFAEVSRAVAGVAR